MTSDPTQPELLPWWIRTILAVATKEGLAYTIAIIFVAGTCWIGYESVQLLQVIAARHISFLDSQTTQMSMQTQVLNQMTQASTALNASNIRQEALQFEIVNKMNERQEEHEEMIKALIVVQKKLMAE